MGCLNLTIANRVLCWEKLLLHAKWLEVTYCPINPMEGPPELIQWWYFCLFYMQELSNNCNYYKVIIKHYLLCCWCNGNKDEVQGPPHPCIHHPPPQLWKIPQAERQKKEASFCLGQATCLCLVKRSQAPTLVRRGCEKISAKSLPAPTQIGLDIK